MMQALARGILNSPEKKEAKTLSTLPQFTFNRCVESPDNEDLMQKETDFKFQTFVDDAVSPTDGENARYLAHLPDSLYQ